MSEYPAAPDMSSVEAPPGTDELIVGAAEQSHWVRRIGHGMLAATAAVWALHGAMENAFASEAQPLTPTTPAPKSAGLLEGAPKQQTTPTPKKDNETAIAERAEAPLVPPERTTTFQLGVVVGNSQTNDAPNFFPDARYLRLNGVRESLFRSNWKDQLPIIQNDIATAPTYGIEYPVINLADTTTATRVGFPNWAARMMTMLPAVQTVIIENEVNAEDFYAPNGETDPLTRLHMAVDEQYQTYQAIKAVRPDVQVYAFGLDSILSHDPVGFLNEAAQYAFDKYGGLQNIADGISFHCYLDPEKCAMLTEQYEGITALPLRMDEQGRNVANGISYRQQAKQTGQIIMHAANDPQVQSVLVYKLANGVLTPADNYETGPKSSAGKWLPLAYTLRRLAPVVTTPPEATNTSTVSSRVVYPAYRPRARLSIWGNQSHLNIFDRP